jgi:hypothetical protein
MFKRQKERHPFKWFAVTVGLSALSFASFSAGVQFATLTLEDPEIQIADTETAPEVEPTAITPLRVVHKPGQDT